MFTSIEEACQAVVNKDVFAIVYDAPVLRYFADSHDETYVGEEYIVKDSYGIVLKEGNADREAINRNILEFIEDGRFDKISSSWFKSK